MAAFEACMSPHDGLPPLWPSAPTWPSDPDMKRRVKQEFTRGRQAIPDAYLDLCMSEYVSQRDMDARWRLFGWLGRRLEDEIGDEERPTSFWVQQLLHASGHDDSGLMMQRHGKRRLTCKDFQKQVVELMNSHGLGHKKGFVMPADLPPLGRCDCCKAPCESECICGEHYCSRECLLKDWDNHREICETFYESHEIGMLMNMVEFNKVRRVECCGYGSCPSSGASTGSRAPAPQGKPRPAARSLGGFSLGDLVVIDGLTSAAGLKLNGSHGEVVRCDVESGRLAVRLGADDASEAWKSVRPENLRPHDGASRDRIAAEDRSSARPSAGASAGSPSPAPEGKPRLAARSLGSFSLGDLVVIDGLTSAAGLKLNGSQGKVVRCDVEKGRLAVRLAPGDPPEAWKSVRPENLRPQDGESGGCGGAEECVQTPKHRSGSCGAATPPKCESGPAGAAACRAGGTKGTGALQAGRPAHPGVAAESVDAGAAAGREAARGQPSVAASRPPAAERSRQLDKPPDIRRLPVWKIEEKVEDFNRSVLEMFTVEELEARKAPEAPKDFSTDQELRETVHIMLKQFFQEDIELFAICPDGPGRSTGSCDGWLLQVRAHELRRLVHPKFQRTVPLLVLSWTSHDAAHEASDWQGPIQKIWCGEEEVRQLRSLLSQNGELSMQMPWSHPCNKRKALKRKGWWPSFLLPLYPNDTGPTLPNLELWGKMASKDALEQAKARKLEAEHPAANVQCVTGVKTHHFFLLVGMDQMVRDSQGQVYVFEERADGLQWAEHLVQEEQGLVQCAGMGDEKWDLFQRTQRYVLVKSGSRPPPLAGATGTASSAVPPPAEPEGRQRGKGARASEERRREAEGTCADVGSLRQAQGSSQDASLQPGSRGAGAPEPGEFTSVEEFLAQGTDRGLCMAIMRGLATDSSFITHKFVPVFRGLVQKGMGGGEDADFRSIMLSICDEAAGTPVAPMCAVPKPAVIVQQLDAYLERHRGDVGRCFMGHYLRGFLLRVCGDHRGCLMDFREALRLSGEKHAWVLINCARAEMNSLERVEDLPGISRRAGPLYERLIAGLRAHIKSTGKVDSMLCFALWEFASLRTMEAQTSSPRRALRSLGMYLPGISDKQDEVPAAIMQEVKKLAAEAEEVEQRCLEELPEFEGIGGCDQRDMVRIFLQLHDGSNEKTVLTSKQSQLEAAERLAERIAKTGEAVGKSAELDSAAMAESVRATASAQKRRAEEVSASIDSGTVESAEVLKEDVQTMFSKKLKEHAKETRMLADLYDSRRKSQDEREASLQEAEVRLKQCEKTWQEELGRMQEELSSVRAWVGREKASQDRHYEEERKALSDRKDAELQGMKEQMRKLEEQMRKAEADYEQQVREKDEEQHRAMRLLEQVLDKHHESEAQSLRVLNDVAHQRREMQAWNDSIEHKERDLKREEEKLRQQQAEMASRQKGLAEERARMERQRVAFNQQFEPPSAWAVMAEAQDYLLLRIQESGCLDALRACLQTPHPEWLGQGRDIRSHHSGAYALELVHAWRVQNRPLWTKYRAELRKMASDLEQCGLSPPGVGVLQHFQHTASALGALDSSVGEEFLLHGTGPAVVGSILREGLNERFTGRAAFGFGTYLCEDAGKADQYVKEASQADQRALRATLDLSKAPPRDLYYVFVCRTALGYPVHTLDGELSVDGGQVWAQTRSRASKRELNPIPGAYPPVRYHSQVVDVTEYSEAAFQTFGHGRVYRYREFVVPHSDRVYPEFLVAYRRVAARSERRG